MEKLLQDWGFSELVPVFQEQEIDLKALLEIPPDGKILESVLPKIELRIKFMAKLKQYKMIMKSDMLLLEDIQDIDENNAIGSIEQRGEESLIKDILSSFEHHVNIALPIYLRNLLLINGYDNWVVLSTFADDDIEKKFAREELPDIISKDEFKNFYGQLYFQRPKNFRFVAGHRTLLFHLKDFAQKSAISKIDKSTMTEDVGTCRILKTKPTKRDLLISHNTDLASALASSFGSSEIELFQPYYAEENSVVNRIQQKWAKFKLGDELWNKFGCESKFNEIVFNTSAYSTSYQKSLGSELKHELVCTITCFCSVKIKIFKSFHSKSKCKKSRWISANFQVHFLKHFNLSEKVFYFNTSKISKKTAVNPLISDIPSHISKTSQPRITNYLTEVSEEVSVPSTSGIQKRLTTVKKAEVPKEVHILESELESEPKLNVSDNSSVKLVETCNLTCNTSNTKVKSKTNKINILQCISLPRTLSNTKETTKSSENINLNENTHSTDMVVTEVATVTTNSEEDSEEDKLITNFNDKKSSKKLNNEPEVFINTKDGSSDNLSQKLSKWKTTKYSRAQRNKRQREKSLKEQSNEQPLITNYITILKSIDDTINQNKDVSKKFSEICSNIINDRGNPDETTSDGTSKFGKTEGKTSPHTRYLLDILVDTACINKGKPNKNMYNDDFKKFSLYLFYSAGKLCYETLLANLKGVLPSLSSLSRYKQRQKIEQKIVVEEGQFNFDGLQRFLEERNLPKVTWLSEDGTRISSKAEYNSKTNMVMGFPLPLENGVPNPNAFVAKSAAVIQTYFTNYKNADYGYTIMAHPLNSSSPAFCLALFSTDNKFTAEDVRARWNYINKELLQRGVRVLGISSDGDTRLLKAMKIETAFLTEAKPPHKWYFLDLEITNQANNHPICFMQDSVHIVTKLKTRFLKVGSDLNIGTFTASSICLEKLIKTRGKDEHFLTKSDLNLEDKMNFKSGEKMCSNKVLDCLKSIPESYGTYIYLKLMNFVISSLINKNEKLCDRVYKIWYVIFILRYWRNWIKNHDEYTLQGNFITLNAYTCIELNGHMLLKLISIFQSDDNLSIDFFIPWLFSSQPCEALFRAARSITSTFSTKINFSIKELISRIDRISYINSVLTDLKEKFVFPRETKKAEQKSASNEKFEGELLNIDLDFVIENAMDDAYRDSVSLGIMCSKEAAYKLDIKLPAETSPETLSNFHDERDDTFETDQADIQLNVSSNGTEDSVANMLYTFLENDAKLNDGNELEENIDLKDYSEKYTDVSEDSPFLRITLPNKKTKVIKKSSFCWLLDENNGRISTDRLNRFSSGKRKNLNPKKEKFTKKAKLEVKPSVKPKVKRKISRKVQNRVQNVEHRLTSSETSSNSGTEDFSLNDSTDTETFSDNSAENISTSQGNNEGNNHSNNQLNILEENYYAVQYEEDCFVGRILQRVDKFKFKMKFLKLELGSYIWPNQDDIADVDQQFIFYGPLKLIGTGVFNLKRLDVVNIKKLYKDLKRR